MTQDSILASADKPGPRLVGGDQLAGIRLGPPAAEGTVIPGARLEGCLLAVVAEGERALASGIALQAEESQLVLEVAGTRAAGWTWTAVIGIAADGIAEGPDGDWTQLLEVATADHTFRFLAPAYKIGLWVSRLPEEGRDCWTALKGELDRDDVITGETARGASGTDGSTGAYADSGAAKDLGGSPGEGPADVPPGGESASPLTEARVPAEGSGGTYETPGRRPHLGGDGQQMEDENRPESQAGDASASTPSAATPTQVGSAESPPTASPPTDSPPTASPPPSGGSIGPAVGPGAADVIEPANSRGSRHARRRLFGRSARSDNRHKASLRCGANVLRF